MAETQQQISAFCPEATFEAESEFLLVTVPDARWHELALALRDKLGFDMLMAIVGVDWKDALGCMYYLTNTATLEIIHVKVATNDRENPLLHSVSDVWHVALNQEREVYDFFGIIFINHPDMRRFFLRTDWVGYPLRKDYDASEEKNPLRLFPETCEDDTFSLQEDADGNIRKVEKKVFEPEEYVINIGPQHPSTHGVLRYRTSLDGERIRKVDVVSGYIHRGIEKLCEGLTCQQTLLYAERMDYMAAFMNRHALCLCIEKAMGIEVPHRAELIRMMMDELMRLSSHLLSYGCLTMDQGATTAFFYPFREREYIYDIFDKTCGARMSMSYDCIGGVVRDVHPDFIADVRNACQKIKEHIPEYHKLFTGNVIAVGRMKGVGILNKEDAVNYAITGPTGRASGFACDVRKTHPYSLYNEVKFDEVVRQECDSWGRYMVRLDEMLQSISILEQCCDMLEQEGAQGEFCAKVPKLIKLPQGHWYQQVEASRGAFGVYIESDGDPKPFQKPYRMHFQSPCFNLIGVVDLTCRDNLIADLITITASLDYVIPDIDR